MNSATTRIIRTYTGKLRLGAGITAGELAPIGAVSASTLNNATANRLPKACSREDLCVSHNLCGSRKALMRLLPFAAAWVVFSIPLGVLVGYIIRFRSVRPYPDLTRWQ